MPILVSQYYPILIFVQKLNCSLDCKTFRCSTYSYSFKWLRIPPLLSNILNDVKILLKINCIFLWIESEQKNKKIKRNPFWTKKKFFSLNCFVSKMINSTILFRTRKGEYIYIFYVIFPWCWSLFSFFFLPFRLYKPYELILIYSI